MADMQQFLVQIFVRNVKENSAAARAANMKIRRFLSIQIGPVLTTLWRVIKIAFDVG